MRFLLRKGMALKGVMARGIRACLILSQNSDLLPESPGRLQRIEGKVGRYSLKLSQTLCFLKYHCISGISIIM